MLQRLLRQHVRNSSSSGSPGSQSSSPSSSRSSSSSADSEGSEPGSEDSDSEELRLTRRRAQTQRARTVLASRRLAAAKEKLQEVQQNRPDVQSRGQELQASLFSPKFFEADRAGRMSKQTRWRGIYSYFKALAARLAEIFCANAEVQHVLATYVIDDTNIRMAEDGGGGASAVHTVMNARQFVTVRTKANEIVKFPVHQPMLNLPQATAPVLHRCATSWFFCSAKGLGRCLQLCELPTMRARYQCGVWITDALRANHKVFKKERQILAQQQAEAAEDSPEVHLGLHLTCAIHQLSLIRRPLVLMANDYWSTLVRLSLIHI